MVSRPADYDLVQRATAGDHSAYRELVEKYERRIYAVVFGVMGSRADAEDVTQEAFLKAYRNLKSFRGKSSFYTWIYRIAYNLCLDEKRRKYRKVESVTGEIAELERSAEQSTDERSLLTKLPSPDEMVHRGELNKEIGQALQQLSEEHRAVIMLREFEGLSYEEISVVVGCSKGTVMSRLHHARRKLQSLLTTVFDQQEIEIIGATEPSKKSELRGK